MGIFKGKACFALLVTVFSSLLIMGGCAPAIKYSYDTRANFSEQKTYTWVQSWANSRQDPLLEANVQALADQFLAQKGLTKAPEKPDLMISMNYEFDSIIQQYSYQLRMLTLSIYKVKRDAPHPSEHKELVWRGTACGSVKTDAASSDLRQAVQGILSNFPPN